MSPIKIDKYYRNLASELTENLLKLYEEDRINEHYIFKVFGMLNNISDDKLYINEYNSPQGKKSSILFTNHFLKDFIKEKNISIKVLDGTANFLKSLYDWLGIEIKNEYKDNLKEYPNMKLHYYKFDDVTPFEGRTNKEVKEKMLKFIEKENLSEDFLLFTNKTSTDIFSKTFSKTDYIFSGSDVGSNEYKDEENLIVVFYNTLPQSMRLLWNKDIKGMTLENAQSKLELEIAEYELIGSMMVQLVGRTAIRKDNNADINVYMFCVPPTTAQSIQHHYKIPRKNIFVYDASLDMRKKTNLSVSGLFYLIGLEIEKGKDKIDILKLSKEYYGEKLNKDTIKKIKSRNKDKFNSIASKNKMDYTTRGNKGWCLYRKGTSL